MTSILEDKDQIRELLSRYCLHYDEAQFDRWLGLWAEDAVFDVDGTVMRGRTVLEGFTKTAPLVDGKPPLKHLVMNEIISVDGETRRKNAVRPAIVPPEPTPQQIASTRWPICAQISGPVVVSCASELAGLPNWLM